MQLKYSLTKGDIFFGRIVYTFQNKILLTFSLLVICFLTFSISTGDEARKYGIIVRIVMAIFAFGFSAMLFVALLIFLNLIHTYMSKLTGVIGEHRIEIKEEGLEESTTVDQSFHRWNASFRIKEFGSYVWIYPTDAKFFLVPKTPGRYQGDLSAFLAQLRSKIEPYASK